MKTQALTGITAHGGGHWWISLVILAALGAVWFVRLANAARIERRFNRTKPSRPQMQIMVVRGDITTMEVDAIVNAAKPSLMGGGGVDGAIHRAGGPAILRECRALRAHALPNGLLPGQAVATTAGDLHADWVIHTVGPIYDKHSEDRSAVLRTCYTEALAIADARGARTVAFPLISAGVYGWPKVDAVHQALTALRSARTAVEVATLVMYDEETYRIAQAVAAHEGTTR